MTFIIYFFILLKLNSVKDNFIFVQDNLKKIQ